MPAQYIFLETSENIQILHHAADASWQGTSQSVNFLSLRNGFVAATVFDKSAQKFVWLKSGKTEHATFLQNGKSARSLFPEHASPNIITFVDGLKTALVPEAIYDATAKENFFKLNHVLLPNERIEASFSKKLGAYLLFAIDNNLYRNIIYLPSLKVIHADLPWLEMLLLQHKNSEDTFVHIDVSEKMLAVAVFRNSRLLLYNNFPAETAEDKLYFTMFVSEQLRINPHKDFYYLSGEIIRTDETHVLFSKYIKELNFQPRPDMFQYARPLQEIPEHLYFKAFCTPVCEL